MICKIVFFDNSLY